MSTNLKRSAVLSVLGIGLFSTPSVHAQDNYPWKPIQLVVTTAAGGARMKAVPWPSAMPTSHS